jgi:hypothetical protein
LTSLPFGVFFSKVGKVYQLCLQTYLKKKKVKAHTY